MNKSAGISFACSLWGAREAAFGFLLALQEGLRRVLSLWAPAGFRRYFLNLKKRKEKDGLEFISSPLF